MMRLPKVEYIAPASVKEACSVLDGHGPQARALGGGTDLLVGLKLRNVTPALLVALSNIKELKGIRSNGQGGLVIGAMTSLHDIRENSLIAQSYPALAQAATAVGAAQLQYMGTIGGNLCLNTRCVYYNQSDGWRKSRTVCFKMGGDVCHAVPKGKKCFAVFSGDTAPALIALDARVKLISQKEERTIPLQALYTNNGKEPAAIGPGEILSEIHIPPPTVKQESLYCKYRIRQSVDFPLAGVAVRMDSKEEGTCTECSIVLTGLNPAPTEVPEAQSLLKGKALTSDLIDQAVEKVVKAAHPVENLPGASPAYRRHMAGVLARRALGAVASNLGLIQC